MRRRTRRGLLVSAAVLSLLVVAVLVGRELYISRPSYGLPYFARFTPDVEDRWTALGGTWDVVDGAMRNDSNERGAKLLTGSPHWRDYIVEGDFQLLGEGDAGLIARVSDAEVGETSFKGYFAGVRTTDNSLVLGPHDFAYREASKVRMPDVVRPYSWYHLTLKVEGCQITASAWAASKPEVRTAVLNDPDCFRSGMAGLKSHAAGGVWRNVRVLPVGSSPASPDSGARELPSLHQTAALRKRLQANAARTGTRPAPEDTPPVPVQPVPSLLYLPPLGVTVASVRGSVVLTRPAVYVQDSSGGGVQVRSEEAAPLKIGDEVEVTGEVNLDHFSPVLGKARYRLVREGVPALPVPVTATQVASGGYDGRFVQVEGLLQDIAAGKDGSLTLSLDAGTQSFHALLPSGRSGSHLQRLARESRLRLRGVSVVDAQFNRTADPFVILVRSAEDVEIVSGPPWWRPSTLILATLVALGLIFLLNHLFLVAKHWRLRAVAEERERVAHEIHDTLAQSFAGIGFQLQAIRNSVPRQFEVLERHVDLAMVMARTSHEEARRSIASLRPESLGHVGLLSALREYAERLVKNGNVTIETSGEEDVRLVPLQIKDTLFRIGQEAIANAIRHAEPETIRIALQQQRASLSLSVEDDGRGFLTNSNQPGFGLLGMRRRAESISASLVIRSTPGSGTRVEVRTPVGLRFLGVAWYRRSVPNHRTLSH